MASQDATPQTAAPKPFPVGSILKFEDYADPDMTEDQKLLKSGQTLKVTEVKDDGGMTVYPVDENGNQIEGATGDTVFAEEVSLQSEPQGSAPETGKKAPAKKTTAKKTTAKKAEAKSESKKATPKTKSEGKAKSKTAAKKTTESKKTSAKKAEATESKAETTSESLPAVEVQDSAAVQQILSERDALDAAEYLVKKREEMYFTLGGVLHHIYHQGIHKAAGFEGKRGFTEYVKQRLGIDYRAAMYLIRIYQQFRLLGIDEARLSQIGWSKAKELARLDFDELKDNVDDLMEYAENHNRSELQEHIRESFESVETRSEQVKKTRISFNFYADQATPVQRAIEESRARLGGENVTDEMALEQICTEWSMMTEGVEIALEQAVSAVERRFGVSLLVANAEEAKANTEDTEETEETESQPAE